METTAPTETRTQLPFAQHHAFIIGIDKYEQVSPLQTAVNDARQLAEVLATQQHFLVHEPLLNAKGEAIRHLLQALPEKVGEDDRVLFYFAGHGIAADGEDGPAGYIVPADADPTDLKTFIPMEDLHQKLNALPCRHLLLILDCCFSGAFKWSSNFRAIGTLMPRRIYKERFDRFIQDPAWQVLTSAAYDQKALDVLNEKPIGNRGVIKNAEDDNKPHSPFARALFEGLAGAADIKVEQEGDGVITATELYAYIRDQIEPATIKESERLRQTPGFFPLKKHDKGEFIFLHPRHRLNLPPIPKRNPYKGLQSFDETDRELFYGRDRVITELRAKAEESKLLVVSGASGTGKSSVIKAGLLPVLRAEGYRLLPVIRPGINPVFKLERELKTSGLLNPRASLQKQVPAELIKKLRQEKTVLLIDQYEELITRCKNEEARQQFTAILKKLLQETAPENFKLIITVRADFETHFDQGELAAYWQPGRYTVPWFTVEELKEVIIMPTIQEVLIFEPAELVDKIINEVVQEPGALPLLSYTLSELYEAYIKSGRQDRALKKEDYDQMGGVMGALRTKADHLYYSLDASQQSTMRKIMLRMVSLEGELAGKRVMMEELIYADEAENKRVEMIIQKLVEARLIVKGKDYIEPAHDALIRAWKTLLEWIHTIGEDKITVQNRLREQVQEYERLKRDENVLWDNDPRLEIMKLELDNSRDNWLNKRECDFITKSAEVKERKRKRRTRLRFAISSSLTLLSLVAVLFAIRVSVLKYYDDNFSRAKRFEENGGSPIENQSLRERQKSWLYTLAALGEDLDESKSLPASASRLIRQGVAAGVYQQIWSSPGSLSDINDLAFSPNGKLVAIAGDDGSVRFADMKTGAEVNALRGHPNSVSAVAFRHDGKWLASASKDSTIRLWNVETGDTVKTLRGHRGEALSVAFSPDDKILASAAKDRNIILWNLKFPGALASLLSKLPFIKVTAAFDTLKILKGHTGEVRHLAFSPNGRWLASASTDSTIRLWEVKTGKAVRVLKEHHHAIWRVAFSPDGRKLASGSEDRTIRIWDWENNAVVDTLTGHRAGVCEVAFSPDGKWLVSASADSTIRIWDMTTAALQHIWRRHAGSIRRVAFSPDHSNRLLSAASDRSLLLWNFITGEALAATAGHRDKINCLAFSVNDQFFASGSDDGTIIIWEAATGRQMLRLQGHHGAVLSLDFREFADLLVSSGKDQTIRLWYVDIDSGKVDSSKVFTGHTGAVNSIVIDPAPTLTPEFIVSGSDDRTIRLWKVADGSSRLLGRQNGSVKSIVIDRDGTRVASGASDGTMCIWNLTEEDAQQPVVCWYAHEKTINALAFNHNGTMLASASDDDEIRLWDVGKRSRLFDFFKNRTEPLRFGRSETRIFTLNERSLRELRVDDNLPNEVLGKLFDAEIRDQPIHGEANFLDTLRALINDHKIFEKYKSSILARASKTETEELTAYLVNAEIAKGIDFLEILHGHEDDVLSVAFSEDGRLLASGSRDETIRIWEVNAASELAVLPGHEDDVYAVALNHAAPNAILASGARDRSIRLWDVEESCNLDKPIFNQSPVRALALSPNGQYLTAAGDDQHLRLWKIKADRADNLFDIKGGWSILLSVAFSPDGLWLAYGGKDDMIRLLHWKSRQIIPLSGNAGDGLSVAFHPQGRYLAAGSSDGKIRIWDLTSRRIISEIKAHRDKIRSIAFNPDGTLLASAGSDKFVQLWRFKSGQPELWKTYDHNQGGVWSIDFSPDGNWLATASWDNTIHLWNFQIDQSRQLRGHRGPVLAVKFSPDGQRLASGSWDHTIRLWELKSGRELDVITVHKAPVTAVAFDPSGLFLVSGAKDQSIRLRDLTYLNPVELITRDSLKLAFPDTSARIRDLIYLTKAPSFKQRSATHRPYQTVFQAYAHRLAYRLDEDLKLSGEPQKFYLQSEDSAKIKFAAPEFEKLRHPRPRHEGPIQWSLQNISDPEQTKRRQAIPWLLDTLKRIF